MSGSVTTDEERRAQRSLTQLQHATVAFVAVRRASWPKDVAVICGGVRRRRGGMSAGGGRGGRAATKPHAPQTEPLGDSRSCCALNSSSVCLRMRPGSEQPASMRLNKVATPESTPATVKPGFRFADLVECVEHLG